MQVCTQPRRVACTSVASRVADEMGTLLGDRVGYDVALSGMGVGARCCVRGMLPRNISSTTEICFRAQVLRAVRRDVQRGDGD
jgi:hypothetical protein